MMMNEQSKTDLALYTKQTLWAASILLSIIVIALSIAWFNEIASLIDGLFGAFVGALIACINLFSIGYAFLSLAIEKNARWAILWPLISFLAMCSLAFIFAIYFPQFILGFALGLTTPVVLGAVIVFLATKPG